MTTGSLADTAIQITLLPGAARTSVTVTSELIFFVQMTRIAKKTEVQEQDPTGPSKHIALDMHDVHAGVWERGHLATDVDGIPYAICHMASATLCLSSPHQKFLALYSQHYDYDMVMLRYVMMYFIVYYIISCRIILYHCLLLYCVISCHAVLCYATLCYIALYYTTLYYFYIIIIITRYGSILYYTIL